MKSIEDLFELRQSAAGPQTKVFGLQRVLFLIGFIFPGPYGLCREKSLSPNASCHQTAFVTKRPSLPNGLCHQTALVTKQRLSPNGLRRQTVCVTNGLPVCGSEKASCFGSLGNAEGVGGKQTYPERQEAPTLCSRGCFGTEVGYQTTYGLRGVRAARKKIKLKFALCSRGCFGKEVGY